MIWRERSIQLYRSNRDFGVPPGVRALAVESRAVYDSRTAGLQDRVVDSQDLESSVYRQRKMTNRAYLMGSAGCEA